MHPAICTIGPFTIYSYGLMLAIAFMVSSSLAASYAAKKGIPSEAIYNLTLISFICGLLGARIFYIVQNLDYYRFNPREIVMLAHGGLAWFGGLFAGAIAAITFIGLKKLPLYAMLDTIAPFIALGQAIGRIGCLLNGCCYGKESIFGLYFPVHNAMLIPTQIYSSIALLIIFIVLRILQERPLAQGAIFFSYLLCYSIKRFFMEFLRADSPACVGGLTLFQILSVIVFFVATIKLISLKKS